MVRSSELKKRCRLAKQRLKMGYWDSLAREEQVAEKASSSPEAVRQKLRRGLFEREDAASAADEELYKKVCGILGADELALDPIGQLIEHDVYDGLDHDGRQRYVLQLSQKFRELSERYYREKTGS